MASNDVRDILDVSVSKEARPSKKAKVSTQQKIQLSGLSKEVRGLMIGDSIAPIQVQEAQYKQKPKLLKKVRPWTRAPFRHPLRDDGLLLRHWTFHQKDATQPGTPKSHGAPVTPADSKVEQDRDTQTPPNPDSEYRFVKYSLKPSIPTYDSKQYEANLTDDEWSKEETDYLMEIAKDMELRWIAIWDRYDYHPAEQPGEGDAMTVALPPKPRSMEDLKYRYYQVAAKMMAIHQPLSSMSASEFELYEKMLKFDPSRETTRKKLATALMGRSPEEIREEEILLGELKRIVDNEERFLEERRELYQRLDFPQSSGSVSAYETSAGLQSLVIQMANNDRSKIKRRSLIEGGGSGAAGPSHGGSRQDGGASGRGDQRSGTGMPPGKNNKKGGGAGGAGGAGAQRRELSARDEAKFGVTHHERLTSGVSFRQGRVEKLVLAKSASQAQKLHDALAELSVPVKAVMPTNRVCAEYERLIAGIHSLLDARKTAEKMSNEMRVLQAQKETRERRERGEEEPAEDEAKAQGENAAAADADEDEDEDKLETPAARREDDDDDDEDEDAEDQDDGEADTSAKADNEDEDEDDDDEGNNESWHAARGAEDDDDEDQNGEDDEGEDDDADVQADSEDGDEGKGGHGEEDDDDEGEAENDEDDVEAELSEEEEGRDEDDDEERAEADVDGDEDDEDGEGEEGPEDDDEDDGAGAGEDDPDDEPLVSNAHKRSASALSDASQHSSKRTRR